MKSIRFKIWVSLFLMLATFMLALSAFTYHSTKNEFLRYVNHETVRKLDFFTQALAAEFAKSQNFDALTSKPNKWKRFIGRTFQPQFISHTPNEQTAPNNKQRIQAKPSQHQRKFMQRLILTDKNKTLLAGKKSENSRYAYRPIKYNQTVVGYVGFTKPTRFIRAIDQRFIEKQITVISITSLCLLVICVLAAFVVSHWLTKPIVALRRGVQRLKEGDFSTIINVQSTDEIGALSLDINELARTLESNESSRKRWVADISHEMRTPVAVLKAQIEALQDGIRPPNAENIELLQTKVQALNTLIDDLYTLSLSDAGALNYAKTRLEMGAFYTQQAEHFNQQMINKNIRLHFKEHKLPSNTFVHGDEQKLKQLIENLIANAIRYTDAPGTITCECRIHHNMFELHINDSAPGVSDDQLHKIFERLYRTDSSRSRETGGAGLGLAICKNIVQAHNGEINAQHAELGGLHITVRLPLMT